MLPSSLVRGGGFATLERILQPTDAASFIADYYENQMLHARRSRPDYFADVYNVATFERGVFVASQFAEHLIVVTRADGETPTSNDLLRENPHFADSSYSFGSGDVSNTTRLHHGKLAEAFANGSTLILKGANALTPSLSELCGALERELGFGVRANAYLTPPNSQGFRPHHDTHDTLILQIEGSKYWSVYEQERTLPLDEEVHLLNGARKPRAQVLLEPGDALYLPRGTPHEARTTELRSLHVTLGWYQPRVSDIVAMAVQEAARRNVALRRGLRPGWIRDANLEDELQAEVGSFIGAVAGGDCIAAAIESAFSQVVLKGQGEPSGYLGSLKGLDLLDDATLIEMRDDVSYQIRDYLFYFEVLVAGRTLIFPATCAAAVERMRLGPTPLGELKGIAPSIREELAKRLIACGVARVVS